MAESNKTTAKNVRPLPGLSSDYLVSVFGTESPTLAQRTEYFFDRWRAWWSHGVFLHTDQHTASARHILNDLGLVEFQDYQIRFRQIRFSDETKLAIASMSQLSEYISHRTQED